MTAEPLHTARQLEPTRPRDELADQTAYGGLYLQRLRQAQLSLSLLALAAFGFLVVLLPLVLLAAPALSRLKVLGIPVGALLIVAGISPLFLGIAVLYRRRAEALDDAFRSLMQDE